jgi:hypothetical protein
MAQMGRIGGPLLADNLLRNGVNLAFNTKVLYLDVTNNLVSFNSPASVPGYQLYTPTAIDSTGFLVDTTSSIGDFTFTADTISHATSTITISPNQSSNPTIIVSGLATSNLRFTGNTIVDPVANDNINISPSGNIFVNNSVLVSGNLHATGDITFDGDIQLGNSTSDTVSLTGEINTDIIPTTNGAYDLGSIDNKWNTVYINSTTVGSINQNSLTATTLTAGNLTATLNRITASVNNNLNLVPNGTGKIKFNGYAYVTNTTINNPIPTSPFIINNTGSGYTKISGPGFVIPYGTNNNYPSNPEMGTMRFNTSTKILEIYNANTSTWIPSIGIAQAVTTADIERIVFINELILGF